MIPNTKHYLTLFVEDWQMRECLEDIQTQGKVHDLRYSETAKTYIVILEMPMPYPFVENELKKKWNRGSW